jgi:hypothetical protein
VDAHSTVTALKPGDSIAGFVWGGEWEKSVDKISEKLTCCRRDQGPRSLLVSFARQPFSGEANQNLKDVHNR